MTWSGIRATGRGQYALRFMVEGWPDEWVTDQRITHATNVSGRRVLPGLQYDGVKLSQQAVLRDCWSTVDGITFKVKPTLRAEDTIQSFTRAAVPVGYLAVDGSVPGLSAASTHITLDNGISLPVGYYHVATECIHANGSNTITRAQWDTKAQKHYILAASQSAVDVPVYSFPPSMQGRRSFLYVYGDGDDLSGDGTLVWRGIVSRPPRLDKDGISWTVQCDPITKAMDQSVAAAEDTTYTVRGIYHSRLNPFTIIGCRVDRTSIIPVNGFDLQYVVGHYETQSDFVDAVNTALATIVTNLSLTSDITAISYEERRDNNPTIQFTTDATLSSTLDTFMVGVYSMLEGDLSINGKSLISATGFIGSGTVGNYSTKDVGVTYTENFGDTSYKFISENVPDAFKPPYTYPLPSSRGMIGAPAHTKTDGKGFVSSNTLAQAYNYPDPSNLYPPNRIYLNSVDGLSVGDTLVVKNGDSMIPLLVTAVDATAANRYISVSIQSADYTVYFDANTQLIPLRVFVTNTNVGQFLLELTLQAPNANDGDVPYVTSSDLDTATLIYAFIFTPMDVFWRYRNFIFSKPTPIKDILQEELKALGWMMRLNSSGQVSFAPLPVVSSTATVVALLTDDDIMPPAGKGAGMWPTWEANSDGIVNIINARLGYDPLTDDFDPHYDYSIRNITSVAEHKSNGKGQADFAPKSSSAALNAIRSPLASLTGIITPSKPLAKASDPRRADPSDVARWLSNYMRVVSTDYATVTVAVSFRYFGIRIGDIINVTSALIPNGNGGRGITNKKACIVGTTWNLDPKQNQMGTLTLYFPREVFGGYTPSGRITAQSNTGGNNWTLTFDPANAFNLAWSTGVDGVVVSSFAVGELVQIEITNVATSPTIRTGSITSINVGANQIAVALGSSWTPSSSTWNLVYQPSTAAITTRQKDFVYVADDTYTKVDGTYADRYV